MGVVKTYINSQDFLSRVPRISRQPVLKLPETSRCFRQSLPVPKSSLSGSFQDLSLDISGIPLELEKHVSSEADSLLTDEEGNTSFIEVDAEEDAKKGSSEYNGDTPDSWPTNLSEERCGSRPFSDVQAVPRDHIPSTERVYISSDYQQLH